MNLVLLEEHELGDGPLAARGRATLGGRRARHIAEIHRATVGQSLRVGVVGGRIGSGIVASVSKDLVELDVELTGDPPPALPCTLVLALPRPLVLGRILAFTTAFGVKRIVLFASQRVEKSYWQSPVLHGDSMRGELMLGLEQSGDTMLPVVEMHRRFRPFVEDVLPSIAKSTVALLAHPAASEPCPRAAGGPFTIAVGPEGGFVDFEVERMTAAGLTPVTLGTRPLRVEPAVAALLGRLS